MRKIAAITGVLLLLLCLAGCSLQLEAPQTVSRETLEELHSSLQPEPQPQPEPLPSPNPFRSPSRNPSLRKRSCVWRERRKFWRA